MGIFKRDYNYNPYFFNKIQPVGGIKFNPRSIVKGDGYEACLRIYDFPTSVDEFWLGKLIDIKDVTVTIDVETEDRSKALQSLNSAISENVDRANSLKNNIDIIEANNATSILMGLVNDITSRDEVIKLVTIRYYLSAKTEIELEEKIKELLESAEDEDKSRQSQTADDEAMPPPPPPPQATPKPSRKRPKRSRR